MQAKAGSHIWARAAMAIQVALVVSEATAVGHDRGHGFWAQRWLGATRVLKSAA